MEYHEEMSSMESSCKEIVSPKVEISETPIDAAINSSPRSDKTDLQVCKIINQSDLGRLKWIKTFISLNRPSLQAHVILNDRGTKILGRIDPPNDVQNFGPFIVIGKLLIALMAVFIVPSADLITIGITVITLKHSPICSRTLAFYDGQQVTCKFKPREKGREQWINPLSFHVSCTTHNNPLVPNLSYIRLLHVYHGATACLRCKGHPKENVVISGTSRKSPTPSYHFTNLDDVRKIEFEACTVIEARCQPFSKQSMVLAYGRSSVLERELCSSPIFHGWSFHHSHNILRSRMHNGDHVSDKILCLHLGRTTKKLHATPKFSTLVAFPMQHPLIRTRSRNLLLTLYLFSA
ncbi:hypothetical protein VNO77_15432 [Canavalia gladiata]|uniref:Uncharacterized protein n=1 Tax=Canavalia gladiata TaxID=3824 RepID=A0AAN9M4B7_CANGL